MALEESTNSADVQKRGKVVIISGPSGVGKGTLVKKLLNESSFPLVLSVSATTRTPRPGEVNGREYWFISRDEFLEKRANGEFLESFEVYEGGALYGTLRETVETQIRQGKWVLLEIDVKGALSVMKELPDSLSIFILPPSLEALRERLLNRGTENGEDLAKRLEQAEKEISYNKYYKERIVNDNLDKAFEELVDTLASYN
ncbi:MAG: guanylate kinase [Planctomycetia bacterium]|nr:guanylate kinase [Planctomycetia bacterium]